MPFCKNSLGDLQVENSYDGRDTVFMQQQYLSYLKYGNSRVLELLDKHPDYKDKIVIISGDHGPRYPFLIDKKWQLNPFLAIYTPKGGNLKEKPPIQYLSRLPLALL